MSEQQNRIPLQYVPLGGDAVMDVEKMAMGYRAQLLRLSLSRLRLYPRGAGFVEHESREDMLAYTTESLQGLSDVELSAVQIVADLLHDYPPPQELEGCLDLVV